MKRYINFYLGTTLLILLLLFFVSCKKDQSTQIRFQNVDIIHDFSEFNFGNIYSSKLKNKETTDYIEVAQGEYYVEWEFFAWGTYWSSSADVITISDYGKYTLKITINEATLVKD